MSMRDTTLGSGGWMLSLILSLLFSMVLGLALVWLSIDRNDTAYTIHKMQAEAEEARAHLTKLEVERDSLLSPYVLGRKAEQLGMGMADPGQVRRLKDPAAPESVWNAPAGMAETAEKPERAPEQAADEQP